jgi:outer membrane protein assembly factor BamA
MKRPLAIACLAAAAALAGCASAPPPVAPKRPAAPVADPLPPCPESLIPGGDPLDAPGFEGAPVGRFCLVGGSAATRAAAERVTLVRPGDTLTAEHVRADLTALMRLGAFADASAFGLRAAQGGSVMVLYDVRDRPLVAEIAVEGAKVLGDAALTAKLPVAKGSPYDPRAVHGIAQSLRDGYLSLGYGSCRAVVVTEPVTRPAGAHAEVSVHIKVDEGVLWRLAKLEFRGNKKVSEAELRKATALKVGQPYVEEEIEAATRLYAAVLYDRGLVGMSIDAEKGPIDKNGNVPLTVVIDEGDVHTIAALHVTKLGAPLEKEILEKVLRVRPKQPFVRTALVDDITRLKEFFAKRGEKVEIFPQTDVDAQKHAIDITLVVEKASP